MTMKQLRVTEREYRILFARSAIQKSILTRWTPSDESADWQGIMADLWDMLRPHVALLIAGSPELIIE